MSIEYFNAENFNPESAALFLVDNSFYHKSIPLLSISISFKQQFEPKIQHMLYYTKDTAIKHFIIRTESCKGILPGW